MAQACSIEHYKTKFYAKENSSKRFTDLDEEQLSFLAKRVYKMQEKMADNQMQNFNRIPKLDRYYKTLQYLTNPLIHLELKTYDERMAFMIMMCDPNLVIFKEFLKLDLVSKNEIEEEKDPNKKVQLQQKRSEALLEYENVVREKIGFFDAKLLKYEEMYFKTFFGEKELITEVKNNNHDYLMFKAKLLKNFNGVTDERYEELKEVAQTWLSLCNQEQNINAASYSVNNQKNLLGLKNTAEQLTLFILLVDSELDMLRIFEEESKMPIIEERIIEQFGYFDKELLILEKKYHDRFCPDKELSIWTKQK